jgi:hypothetical protein
MVSRVMTLPSVNLATATEATHEALVTAGLLPMRCKAIQREAFTSGRLPTIPASQICS